MAAFKPAQQQRWNFLAGFEATMSVQGGRRILRAWIALAILSLAIAGLAAPLLALSRIPAIADWGFWPVQAFEKGLILHVIFSFVIWLLAVFAALVHVATCRRLESGDAGYLLSRIAIWAMATAFILLAYPAMTRALPSLNNYIPVIIHPAYYWGLGLIALALIATLVRFTLVYLAGDGAFEPVGWTAAAGGFVIIATLVCIGLSWQALGGAPLTEAANEDLFWAGGHALQFLNVILLCGGWYVLGSLSLGKPALPPKLYRGCLAIAVAGVLPAIGFFFVFDPLSADHRIAYTLWQYGLAPAPVIVGGAVMWSLWQARKNPSKHANARLALLLSIVTFAIGGYFGLFVDGTDTRTPAHYHGVIGGLNIAAFGLILFVLLPLAGRTVAQSGWVRALFWLYAYGQIVHAASLFLAGGYGAPRKVAGEVAGLDAIGAQIGLYGTGVGGLLAVGGGVIFVVVTLKALRRKQKP